MKKTFNILAIFLILVVFPAASYYYMRDGWNYRVRAIEAQGDFGKMPDLGKLKELRGKLPENLRGSMVVVGWLDQENPQTAEVYGRTMDSLFQQFESSPNLYFTTITNGDSAFVEQWSNTYRIPDDPMLSVLATDEAWSETARDFQLPVAPGVAPIVAMVDSSMTIRKFYNLDNRKETVGLVQLISLIIPLPEKADIVRKAPKEL